MQLDRPLAVTFFDSSAAATKRTEYLSLRALAPRILRATNTQKKGLPWLKLATFGDKLSERGSYRHNENMLEISGVEGDYDAGLITVAAAVECLRAAKLAGMIYTSPSHNEDSPRWRVLCPLSDNFSPEARAVFLARLNGVFQGALAPESFTLSQAYYFGSINANPSHTVELVAGDYLDQRDDLDDIAIGKTIPPLTPPPPPAPPPAHHSKYITSAIRNAMLRVAGAQDGQKHHILRNQARLLGGYQAEGDYSKEEAVGWLLQSLPASTKDWKAARATAEWAFELGLKAPIAVPDLPLEMATKAAKRGPPPEQNSNEGGEETVAAGNVVQIRKKPGQKQQKDPPDPSIPSWKDAWHCTENGSPLPTTANAVIAFQNHPPLVGMVRYDEMQGMPLLFRQVPGRKHHPKLPCPMTDADVIAMQIVLQHLGLRRINRATVQDAIDYIANENSFHPIRSYLDGLVWDGVQRVRGWVGKYLGVEGSPYSDEIGQMFLIAMVARIYRPGCQSDYMPVLEGPQGGGKSSACRILGGIWFSDTLPDLTRSDPVRLAMHLRGKWLIEIPELSSFSKSQIENVKAFVTSPISDYTPKYARNEVREPRQCLLIGSTNQKKMLIDDSGGRRFWVITVGIIDLIGLAAVRDQLFAEAVHLFNQGAAWWPDKEFEAKFIKPEQDARLEDDSWEEPVSDWLAAEGQRHMKRFTLGQIARGALFMEAKELGTPQWRKLRSVMIRLGWREPVSHNDGRKWRRPEKLPPRADDEEF